MCDVCGNTWWVFARVVASLDLMCVLEVNTLILLWVGECGTTWKVEDGLVQDPVVSAGRSSGPPAVLSASPAYKFHSPPLPKAVHWHFTFLLLCKECYNSKYCSPTISSFEYRSAFDWPDIYLLYEVIHGCQALSLKENGDDVPKRSFSGQYVVCIDLGIPRGYRTMLISHPRIEGASATKMTLPPGYCRYDHSTLDRISSTSSAR
jgi:hypothetical protein